MTPRELCSAFIENDSAQRRPDPARRCSSARPGASTRAAPAALPGAARAGGLALRCSSAARCSRPSSSWAARCPPACSATRRWKRSCAACSARPGAATTSARCKRKLVLVATDLDSGEAAPFGQPGWDHVPISQAVAGQRGAAGAVPAGGDRRPPLRRRRAEEDAARQRAARQGLDLLFCLNPLVPFDATHAPRHRVLSSGDARIPQLVDGGLPVVLSPDLPHPDPLAPGTRA